MRTVIVISNLQQSQGVNAKFDIVKVLLIICLLLPSRVIRLVLVDLGVDS